MIAYAIEQDREETLYNAWLHGWNKSMAYEEFKKQSTMPKEEDISVDEILDNVKNILNMDRG